MAVPSATARSLPCKVRCLAARLIFRPSHRRVPVRVSACTRCRRSQRAPLVEGSGHPRSFQKQILLPYNSPRLLDIRWGKGRTVCLSRQKRSRVCSCRPDTVFCGEPQGDVHRRRARYSAGGFGRPETWRRAFRGRHRRE